MTKKIFPGNWVSELSSYQAQPVECMPGRVYFKRTGYALVNSTGGTSFDVTIPSPDLRNDDKPRANITGLVIPSGANVYHLGLRVPDLRKDRAFGTAVSGLTGTSTNRLKLASAVGTTATGVISATALGTDSSAVAVANSIVTPVATAFSAVTPSTLSGALTLKVYVTDATGAAAGSNLSSTQTGGTPVIVEVGYYLPDDVTDLNELTLPFITESA